MVKGPVLTDSITNRVTPRNPLGVISLFVFLIETVATVSLHAVADQPYAAVLVWFIVTFPSVIAVLFFLLLWFKREALFGPMDFRDDDTFRDLLLKVSHIEAKQDLARIDRNTTVDDVNVTVDKLLELDDTWSAISVGRAFLKQGEYQKSRDGFAHIASRIPSGNEAYYKVIANTAYSDIGLGHYKEAMDSLSELKKLRRGRYFSPWHSLAMAYACLKNSGEKAYQKWMAYTREHGGEELDTEFFVERYPEISEDIEKLGE